MIDKINDCEKYYYYDKENDCVVECTMNEYKKVDPKVRDNNRIKCDKFSLGSVSSDVDNSYGLKTYTISTICLMKDHRSMFDTSINPTIFETMVFTDDKNYNGYYERHTCLKWAKIAHDALILKILRGEEND
ncbi:MAG: hypothetical protein ACO3UL_08360 [Flavobacteriaceae bacterium]